MDENTANTPNTDVTTSKNAQVIAPQDSAQPAVVIAAPTSSSERPANEQRQAYGTAKTENLRDSGAWRVLLPGFVALCCLALLAVPLLILIPLLSDSIDASSATHSLIWLWISMIVIEVAVAVGIIWGLVKIFMTQAGNYSRS
ncbi:MAG TPA: hypothetical protein VKU38_05685 [Ktedonobacteraceae bacterium]|nr:hypothetical protein [Ktedonobacteraceae bacterium]